MSPTFAELFPQEYYSEHLESLIQPGAVFRIHAEQMSPPKVKRFVVFGSDESNIYAGSLVFNSRVNINVFFTTELQKLHLWLGKQDRGYLTKDCFLDCSKIFELSIERLKNEYEKDTSCYCGKMSDKDLQIAVNILKNAPTINKIEKKKYNLVD